MFKLIRSFNFPLIKSIMMEPTLWDLECGQGCSKENFEPDKSYIYLLVKKDDIILGMLQVREMTKVLLEVHSFMLPQYWHQGYTDKIPDLLAEWASKNTQANKIITFVPQTAKHVHAFLEKVKAEFSGLVQDGIIYDGKLMPLYLYTYPIKRDQ